MSIWNPFTNRSTIYKESEFFGRRRELYDIYSRLMGGQSVSLVGERRVGKSSLLQALDFPGQRSRFRIPPALRIVHLDLQYMAGCEEDDFLEYLLEEAGDRLEVDEVGPPRRESLRRLAKEAVRGRSLQLVIALDEFDVLLNNRQISLDFFAYLRAWSSEFRICFVGASREGGVERMLESSGTGSAFLNVFGSVYIGHLREEEALELIVTPARGQGIEFDPSDIERVVELAGFHPYFVQIACCHLFQLRQPDQPQDDLDVALEQKFRHEAMDNLVYLFERLSEEELKALRSFALGGNLVDSPAVYHLERKGILIDWQGRRRLFSRTFEKLLQSEIAQLAASDGGLEGKVAEGLLKDKPRGNGGP